VLHHDAVGGSLCKRRRPVACKCGMTSAQSSRLSAKTRWLLQHLEKTAIAIPSPALGRTHQNRFKNGPQNRGAAGGPPAIFNKPMAA